MPANKKYLAHLFLFPLGLALLFAMIPFQEGTALTIQAEPTPTATLSPFERLAEPTLPSSPTQADYGAHGYWLLCLPCHGDRGQGLTEEFRETYPPAENNCWERGCHGKNPYEDGFKLPLRVPALIGPDAALEKFSNANLLNMYISAAMPYWNPGSLTEEESWQVTAFLLRENGITYTGQLNASNAGQILLSPSNTTPTPMPTPQSPPSSTQMVNPVNWGVFLPIFLLGGILFLWHTLRRNQN